MLSYQPVEVKPPHANMKSIFRTCFSCWILLLLFQTGYSQQPPNAENYLQRIATAKEDTLLIKAYYDYALAFEAVQLDSAVRYYKLGGDLSKKLDYYPGISHFARNNSVVLNMQGKFDESMALNRSLLTLATGKNHQLDIAKTLNNIASVFNHRGQYDSAYHYYLQSARLFESLHDDRYLNIIYQNIGIILDNLKQYDKSLMYHHMSLHLSRQRKDTASITSVLLNAAGTFGSMNNYDSSLVYSMEALSLARKIGNLYYQQVAHLTLGNIYAHKKDYPASLQNFTHSLEIAQSMDYPSGQAVSLGGLAMASLKMGRLKKANEYALQSLDINKANDYFAEYTRQVKLLADIKSELKQFDSAYHYLEIYTNLQDSLAGINTKKYVADLEMKYQTALKDRSITAQQLEIRQHQDKIRSRNNWLLIALGSLLIVSAISIATYISNRSRKKLLSQEILTLQKEKELETFKAAMEAREQERQRIAREMHDDLGAGLTTILYQASSLKASGKADDSQLDKICETSATLVSQMRDIVWAMNYENDTLDTLVAYIRHQGGSMLSQNDINYEINVPDEIPDIAVRGEQRRNIYLATREALHNVIKHANATKVKMDITVADSLEINIADDGKGISVVDNAWGNGLKNMEARMRQSGGSFSYSSTEPGTLIRLALPLDT